MKEINYPDGVLTINELEGCVMAMESFALFNKMLLTDNKKKAEELLINYGEDLIRNTLNSSNKREIKNTLEAMRDKLNLISNFGFGKPKIIRYTDKKIIITVQSQLAINYKKVFGIEKHAIDFVVAGMISKLIHTVLVKKSSIKEKECIVQGKSKCVFEVNIL